MTAITEQTRNASKASRGLNTIMARLASVLDESSSNGKAIIDIYDKLGISMTGTNGQLLSGYELLEKLSEQWGTLTTDSQKYIATTLAGTNQLNNFLALMNNFDHAIDATNTAINSQGSAMQENSRYMESLEAKLTALKATFQDFANAVIDSDVVKALLDVANAVLKFGSTDFGSAVTQIGLLTGVIFSLGSLLGAEKILPIISSQVTTFFSLATKGVSATARAIETGTKAAAGSVSAFSAVMKGSLPIIAGLSIAAVIGVNIYKAWREANPTLEEAKEKIENVNTQLQTNQDRLDEINKLEWYDLTPDIIEERDALEQENGELERQLELLQQIEEKKARKEVEKGGYTETYNAYYKIDSSSFDTSSMPLLKSVLDSLSEKSFRTMGDAINAAREQLGVYLPEAANMSAAELADLGIVIDGVNEKTKVTADVYANNLSISLSKYSDILKTNGELSEDEVVAFANVKAEAKSLVNNLLILQNSTDGISEAQENLISVYNAVIEAEERATALSKIHNEQIELTEDIAGKLKNTFPEVSSAIKEQYGQVYLDVGAFSDLQTAEFETKIKMAELVAALQVFNNTDLDVQGKADQLYKIALAAGASTDAVYILQKIAAGDWGVTEQSLSGIMNNIFAGIEKPRTVLGGTSPMTTTKSETKTDKALEEFNIAQKKLKHLLEMDEITESEYYDKLEKLVKEYKDKATAHMEEYGLTVDKINENMYSYEEDIYKKRKELAEELAKAQQEALEETRKAWEEYVDKQKSDYETAASSVVSKIQEEIEALQERRDAISESYEEEIQALEDSNSALEDKIEYEELLNKLEQAKQQKLYVFKDGKFQYVQDTDAISSAQSDLDTYKRERKLEDEKARIEELRDSELANIDKMIAGWEEYEDAWSDVVEQYTYEQNRLITFQTLGIDLEEKNWETRLINAKEFAKQYNEIMSTLTVASQEGSVSSVGGSSGMSPSDLSAIAKAKQDFSNAKTQAEKDAAHAAAEAVRAKYGYSGGADGSQYISTGKTSKKYASGTLSAYGGISLVGENGPELRVLGNGDGIIPADVTRNLWDWGKINPSMISNQNSTILKIGNVSLPNVNDAQSFVSGLKQLAYQRAYKRV